LNSLSRLAKQSRPRRVLLSGGCPYSSQDVGMRLLQRLVNSLIDLLPAGSMDYDDVQVSRLDRPARVGPKHVQLAHIHWEVARFDGCDDSHELGGKLVAVHDGDSR